jgi:hypothetical protein
LTRFHNFTGPGQLKHYGVGFRLIARPVSAHAKVKIRVCEYLLRFESVLADDVGHLRFRAFQRQVNSRRNSEEKDNNNRDHDCDAAEDGYDSGR